MDYRFEKMRPEHAGAIMDIFNYYTRNSFAAYPEGEIPVQFFPMFFEIGKVYPSLVIIGPDDSVIGFCLLRPYNPFEAFKETAEITSFIKHGFTGKGIGKAALQTLEDAARKMGIRHLLADISSENTGSIEFHRRNGFTQCGRFSDVGKKFGRNFSVVWMEKELI